MGHDEKYCRAYQMLSKHTMDAYQMKGEDHTQGSGAQFNQSRGGIHGCGWGWFGQGRG